MNIKPLEYILRKIRNIAYTKEKAEEIFNTLSYGEKQLFLLAWSVSSDNEFKVDGVEQHCCLSYLWKIPDLKEEAVKIIELSK